MGMKLKEYRPQDILLSNEAVQNIVQRYQQHDNAEKTRDKSRELTISLLSGLTGILVSVITAFSTLPIFARVIVVLIAAGLLIWMAISLYKWVEAYREMRNQPQSAGTLQEMLSDKIQESIRYTAIIRIVTRVKDEMRYLVSEEDFFLPHCAMAPDSRITEQEENIIQCLYDDFRIQQKDIWKISPIDGQVHFSIKPIHGRIQMNGYVFFDVEIKAQAKDKIMRSSRCSWMSLDSMKRNPKAMSTNKDVIDLLDEFPKPKEAFVNQLGKMNIIWNITSQCGYDCSICATKNEKRKELSTKEKLDVLNNIVTAKRLIKTLDFAGGDPLFSEDTTSVIQAAISQLGADKVSVTTTGSGIAKLTERKYEFSDLIKHCEITIDAAHSNLGGGGDTPQGVSRAANGYCETNIEQINILLEHTESLTINIPIINDDLSDSEIKTLVDKIKWIKEHNPKVEIDTLLIRLMPVGNLPSVMSKEDYAKYNPIEVATKIKLELEKAEIVCNPHCSLRVLPPFNDEACTHYCAMLENKVGIDCAGNVFACAWGGYLPNSEPAWNNPFYLGDLKKKKLIDILEGNGASPGYRNIFSEIDSKKQRHFCSVVSQYAGNEMLQDHDYLSKCCAEKENAG